MTKTPNKSELPICPKCGIKISDSELQYDQEDIMICKKCNTRNMKTPEEIKNEVAKKHGYHDWDDLISEYNNLADVSENRKELCKLENEVILAYHAAKVGEAGCELPSKGEYNQWFAANRIWVDKINPEEKMCYNPTTENVYEWMRAKASILLANKDLEIEGERLVSQEKSKLLAKEREKHSHYKGLYDQGLQIINEQETDISTKDKEIEEMKKRLNDCAYCEGKGTWEEYEIGVLTCQPCKGTGKKNKNNNT